MILELHIELQRIKPTVWRKVHIMRDASFHDLHAVIQLLFDWWDAYNYRFEIDVKGKKHILQTDVSPSTDANDGTIQNSTDCLLHNYLTEKEFSFTYIYGVSSYHEIVVSVKEKNMPMLASQAYPCVVAAANELVTTETNEQEAIQFPFGKQQLLQHKNLVKRLNKKLAYYLLQVSKTDVEQYDQYSWHKLFEMTKKYYAVKPWANISNEQIIAIYDERYDEYLFCSVLGNNSDLYGLSVYVGFSGLLSLHTSLTKNLSIEQLFQIHSNLLLRFELYEEVKRKSEQSKQYPLMIDDNITVQYTSYRPGYFPWQIDEREAAQLVRAIEETLKIIESVDTELFLPNYIEEDRFLLLSKNRKQEVVPSYITFEEIIKKVLPLQLTLSEMEMKRLVEINVKQEESVEFSLQYVNVPIQRLRGARPFLPLSSVIANHHTEQIIYHNVYDDRLNYSIVQMEFIHMINLLGYLPGQILTDDLTHHYLKPLLLQIDLPIKLEQHLRVTENVNRTISQYLLSKVK